MVLHLQGPLFSIPRALNVQIKLYYKSNILWLHYLIKMPLEGKYTFNMKITEMILRCFVILVIICWLVVYFYSSHEKLVVVSGCWISGCQWLLRKKTSAISNREDNNLIAPKNKQASFFSLPFPRTLNVTNAKCNAEVVRKFISALKVPKRIAAPWRNCAELHQILFSWDEVHAVILVLTHKWSV